MYTSKTITTLIAVPVLFIMIACNPAQSDKLSHLQKTEVEILSLLTISDSLEEYSLTLGSKNDTSIKLTMLVGKYEAQTLAISLENLKPKAPLPLDLLQDAITKFGYTVKEVIIDSLLIDIYTAKIICANNNKHVELKARPADAVTIARKFDCPIYVNNILLTR